MKRLFLAAFAALSLAAPAKAATITYELQNTQIIPDPFIGTGVTPTPIAGQISGSFDFDTVLNSVTRVSLIASGLSDTRLNGVYDTVYSSSSGFLTAGSGPVAVGGRYFTFGGLVGDDFANGQPISLVQSEFGVPFASRLGVITQLGPFGSFGVQSLVGVTGTAEPVLAPVPLPLGAGLLLTGLVAFAAFRRWAVRSPRTLPIPG
ncbi:MAG: hypothetical protein AAGA15_11210 [Pseudomonadota bacterium]